MGKHMLTAEGRGGLQGLLLHLAFWLTNLAYFDRVPFTSWPQPDIGIILWCLSVAAVDWQSPDQLMRLCAIPNREVLEAVRDFPVFAFEARVLRPLMWFGLLERQMETRQTPIVDRRYRKSRMFDRFVVFDVKIEGIDARPH
jgi:hypothetical protein